MRSMSLSANHLRTVAPLVLVVFAACGPAEESAVAEAEGGQLLFEENCASCHGETAVGDGPMAASLPVQPPSLMEHLGHHPMDQLVRIILTGVPPAMPPAPLTEEEILQVIDYAWTLVPDSMVAGLREMQRMAEMGMDMSGMMGGAMGADSSGAMMEMDHGAMGHGTPPDTSR